jgi:hypothetical protein
MRHLTEMAISLPRRLKRVMTRYGRHYLRLEGVGPPDHEVLLGEERLQ